MAKVSIEELVASKQGLEADGNSNYDSARATYIRKPAGPFLHGLSLLQAHYTVYDKMSEGVLAAQSAGRRRRG